MEPTDSGQPPLENPCKKCNEQEATLVSRTEAVCDNCYASYVAAKCVVQMGLVSRATRTSKGPSTRRYLLGLSFGAASSGLLHLLDENVEQQMAKGRIPPFELTVVHVDTDLLESEDGSSGSNRVEPIMNRYRELFPRCKFETVHLTSVLGLRTIDWANLPPSDPQKSPRAALRRLFEELPSPTSRADLLRIFVRHVLISEAHKHACSALLLGYTTTALAELTLAEAAKGRGYSLPWQINDGSFRTVDLELGEEARETTSSASTETGRTILVHYPLRELFRKELKTYTQLVIPPSHDLITETVPRSTSVVSHKDLTIDEVMGRYFQDVEENYPGIVANVVKTMSKLTRLGGNKSCGLCGMTLDIAGDERWEGEIGGVDMISPRAQGAQLCYGCQRSING